MNIANAAAFQNGSFENDSANFNIDFSSAPGNLEVDFQDATEGTADLDGWTVEILSASGTYADWMRPSGMTCGTRCYDGDYSVEPAGSPGGTGALTRFSQIFDTTSGVTYEVTYYLNGASSATASENEILWTIKENNGSGTTLHTVTDTPASDNTWSEYSFTFTATSASTYLAFENTIQAWDGTTVDHIVITAVPELPNFSSTLNANYPDDPTSLNLKAVPG